MLTGRRRCGRRGALAARGRDATGYRTLRAVLGLRSKAAARAFERRWRKRVMGLSFG